MNFLLIGAGQLGSRHLQALAAVEAANTIYVVEPNDFCMRRAQDRWDDAPGHRNKSLVFTTLAALNDEEVSIALAIVATPSNGRADVLAEVIKLGVKKILCEKVLFQSVSDYRSVMEMARLVSADIVVNHIYRYVPVYQEIRQLIGGRPLRMYLDAGNNGMGCNLIHFIDLFQYLSRGTVIKTEVQLDKPFLTCKRGSDFVEFTGKAEVSSNNGSVLEAVFFGDEARGVVVTIELEQDRRIVINEESGAIHVDGVSLNAARFEPPKVSSLTTYLVAELLEGQTLLPTLEESFEANKLMLAAFNADMFGRSDESTLCPIT